MTGIEWIYRQMLIRSAQVDKCEYHWKHQKYFVVLKDEYRCIGVVFLRDENIG